MGAERPAAGHQPGQRPVLGRALARLEAEPGGRSGGRFQQAGRLGPAVGAAGDPGGEAADPGAARPGLLGGRHHRARHRARQLPGLHRVELGRDAAPSGAGQGRDHHHPPAADLRHRLHPAGRRPEAARLRSRLAAAGQRQAAGVRGGRAGPGRVQLGLRPAALHRARGRVRHRPDGHRTHGAVPADGAGDARGRAAGRAGRGLQPHRRERSGGPLGARPGRPRLLPAARRRREGHHGQLLRGHRARARHDEQAGGGLGRHLGPAVQGGRFPLRPDGPRPQVDHAGRAVGAARADQGEGRGGGEGRLPLRRGLELRRRRQQLPLRAGHSAEHGGHRHRDLQRPRPGRGARRQLHALLRAPAGLRLRALHRPQRVGRQRDFGPAEGPAAAPDGPAGGRPDRQPGGVRVHRQLRKARHRRGGRLQRLAHRLRGQPG